MGRLLCLGSEILGFQFVLFQHIVQIGAIFTGQFGSLADIAVGIFDQLYKVILQKIILGFFQRFNAIVL